MRQDEADASGDDDTRCWRDGMRTSTAGAPAAEKRASGITRQSFLKSRRRLGSEKGGFHSSLKKPFNHFICFAVLKLRGNNELERGKLTVSLSLSLARSLACSFSRSLVRALFKPYSIGYEYVGKAIHGIIPGEKMGENYFLTRNFVKFLVRKTFSKIKTRVFIAFDLGRGGVPRGRPVAVQLSGTQLCAGLTDPSHVVCAVLSSRVYPSRSPALQLGPQGR